MVEVGGWLMTPTSFEVGAFALTVIQKLYTLIDNS